MRFSVQKILATLVALTILFFTGFSFVHAQMAQTPPTTTNMHTYTQNVFVDVIGGLGCLLGGIDITNPHIPCATNTSSSTSYTVNNSGLIGTFASLSGALYTPPIHTSDFTRDVAAHFGLAQKAYADTNAGVGFTSLSPLLTIWKTFRNIAYLVFIIIFVVIGFLIMMRFQIDPRTVMSIENQLPKLVIGLILVTFSFAIAGFLIDAMWVLTFFVINLLTGIDCQLVKCTGDLTGTVTTNIFQNPFGFFNTVAPQGFLGVAAGVGGSVGDVIRGLFTQGNSNQLGLFPPSSQADACGHVGSNFLCGLTNFFQQVVLNDIGSIIGALLSYVVSVLGILIVLVTLLIAMFRIWFSLILAYGFIIVNILLAPFFIVIGMIPGSKVSFTSWLKDMMANLLAFPVIIAILLLGRIVMDAFTTNSQALFVPPLIGNPNGASGGGVSPLGFIFGFFTILVAPQALNITRGIFQVEGGKLGGQIFGNLGMGGKTAFGFAKNILGTITSNDITYEDDGNGGAKMVPVKGPVNKALMQGRKILGLR